ncbi:uncharacterized protein LOC116232821 [Phasianus colchicus]|uniref:uncharacterized protein LOC116232821 n=1 Tax=Phasianus colchicus TaxID=9054 RepID=UPI00129E346F|nr:uncharacterized protein LOC116232821 [Phasianus colchicus]
MTSARTQLCQLFTSGQLPHSSSTNKSELRRTQGTSLLLVMVPQFLRNRTPPSPARTFLLPTYSSASAHEVPDRRPPQPLEAPRRGSGRAPPQGKGRRGSVARARAGRGPARPLRRGSFGRLPPGPGRLSSRRSARPQPRAKKALAVPPAATQRPPNSQRAAPPPLTSVRSSHRARRLSPGRGESAGSHSKPVRPGPRVCFPVQRARGRDFRCRSRVWGWGGGKPWQRGLPGNGARRRRERAKRSCAGAAAAVKPPLLRREARRRDASGTCGPESVREVREAPRVPRVDRYSVHLQIHSRHKVTWSSWSSGVQKDAVPEVTLSVEVKRSGGFALKFCTLSLPLAQSPAASSWHLCADNQQIGWLCVPKMHHLIKKRMIISRNSTCNHLKSDVMGTERIQRRVIKCTYV